MFLRRRFLSEAKAHRYILSQLTGIIPLQNYQVFIYGIAGLGPIMVLIMIGVWGTWVIVAVRILISKPLHIAEASTNSVGLLC